MEKERGQLGKLQDPLLLGDLHGGHLNHRNSPDRRAQTVSKVEQFSRSSIRRRGHRGFDARSPYSDKAKWILGCRDGSYPNRFEVHS